jgi:hypothetical protein
MPCMISTSETLSSSFDFQFFSFLYLYLLTNFLYRSNEYSFVKTNMVHTLHRVKALGCQPLESLKGLLIEEEFRKCT